MKRILTFIFLFVFTQLSFGQKLFINGAVDTSHAEIKKIVETFQGYLLSRPDSIYDNPYWSKEEKSKYKSFDLLRKTFFNPTLYSLGYRPTLLSVKAVDDGFFEIKTLFAYCEDKGYMSVLAVTNHYVKKDNNNEYKFYNGLFINTKNWNRRTIGSINYIYPPEHKSIKS